MKILSVIGTRPEVIKMAPVIRALSMDPFFESIVCATAQHRDMLDQMLSVFDINPDIDLNLMKPAQTLSSLSSDAMQAMSKTIAQYQPDWVLVQGDTTTSFIAALSAFYQHIPVAHVEAGLRTYDLKAPWPEEANRQLTARLANLHFAPTDSAVANLVAENIDKHTIIKTGNTVVDALLFIKDKIDSAPTLQQTLAHKYPLRNGKKLVLITGHRRESFGPGILALCESLKILASRHPIDIIYPVHLNPNVKKPVLDTLSGIDNITLIEPLSYIEFVYLLSQTYLLITDSGGIQEEAPTFGIPTLVTRTKTERIEAITAGTAKLVGCTQESILNAANTLLTDKTEYNKMAKSANPFGDGKAAKRIVEHLKQTP